MKKTLLIILMAVLLGSLAYMIIAMTNIQQKRETQEQSRQQLPAANFTRLDGKTINLKELGAERKTMIIYFSPDCDHCQYEAKAIKAHIDQFAGTVICMITKATSSQAAEFAATYQLENELIHIFTDHTGTFYEQFGMVSVPSIFIYDANGNLKKHFSGEVKIESLIKYIN
ncbi:MAG TPA: redoxin domain-containing protein [Chitinophaga sp.]